MGLGYKLPIGSSNYYGTYNKPIMLFEGKNYIEFLGTPHDKYSLSKFKSMKDLHFNHFYMNPFYIHTNTRFFNYGINDIKFFGRNSFPPEQTLYRNTISFEDGTEIISGISGYNIINSTSISWYNNIHKYKNNKLEKMLALYNALNYSPLIKVNEDSFIAITNDNIPYDLSMGKNYDNIMQTIGYYYNNTIVPYDKLKLFDKELNLIKELTITGELLNIIGRSDNGNFIAIILKGTTSSPYTNTLSVISISPDLVITELANETISTNVHNYKYMCYNQPVLSTDKKKLYFLKVLGSTSSHTTELWSIDIDIPNSTCGNASKLNVDSTLPFKPAFGVNDPANYPLYSINNYYLDYGSKKYLVVSTVFNQCFNNVIGGSTSNFNSRFGIISSGSTYPSQAVNQVKSYFNSMQYLYLYEIDSANNTLIFKEKRSHSTSYDDPVKAIFPVNNKTLLVIRTGNMEVLSVDTSSGTFIQHENIAGNLLSVGIDDLERVWYLRNTPDMNIEMFSPGLSATINIDFENNNIQYDNADVSNNVLVDVKNYNNDRITINLKLTLEGNAVFTNNNLKSINIDTKNDDITKVPITIKGDGIINIYPSIIG